MTQHEPLARRLGLGDAVVVGLGSMVGAGVFAAFAPAAAAAGSGLPVALLVAGAVAWANATSSAQLAVQYPTSGGTYVYGRERLGQWWGYLAGWAFVVGKTASCAAMALTFAAYAVPAAWQRPVAATAVVALAGVNYHGVTRTARLARVLVAAVLVALATWTVAVLGRGDPDWAGVAVVSAPAGGTLGLLQAAGLLFFAFAGYARLATMGEEVRAPRRTIPLAIALALAGAVAVYATVAVTLLATLGAPDLAVSTAPLADAASAADAPWAVPVVRVGAALACLGALLALIAGVGRTGLAMAREGDLPRWLAAVHPRHRVPHHAEVALAAVVVVLVLTVDLRGAIGFSSFGVLAYYLIAHVAAWTQTGADRRSPRAVQVLGGAGCLVLMATLPAGAALSGLAVLAVGLAVRWLRALLSGARSS